jgi:hypothetical protein
LSAGRNHKYRSQLSRAARSPGAQDSRSFIEEIFFVIETRRLDPKSVVQAQDLSELPVCDYPSYF